MASAQYEGKWEKWTGNVDDVAKQVFKLSVEICIQKFKVGLAHLVLRGLIVTSDQLLIVHLVPLVVVVAVVIDGDTVPGQTGSFLSMPGLSAPIPIPKRGPRARGQG